MDDATNDFKTMLNIIYNQLNINPNSKLIIPNPSIENTTTNTYWRNIKKILMIIDRPPEHFLDYLNNEIGSSSWISSSKSDGIVIIGKHNIKTITLVLQNYVKKYVLCQTCKSSETLFERNKELRTYYINCKKCNSKYFY